MLPDRVYQLLTAAVDGELTDREQRAVDKLLRESVEAREFYQKLKSDAHALRNLPRAQLPPHFGTQLLQRLAPVYRINANETEGCNVFSRRLPVWANLAAAAAVLLAISAGTYLFMSQNEPERSVAKNNPTKPENPPIAKQPESPVIVQKSSDPNSKTEPELLSNPRPEVMADNRESPKAVDPGSNDALTAPPRPAYDQLFKVDPPKLPPILTVRELDQDASRHKLMELLKKSEGVHLDLFCKDTNRACERLQAAFRGQRLLIDAVAQERLQRKLKTHYVFYCECLTADEIYGILKALAIEEQRAEAKREGQFDKLVANPLSPNSVKTLSMLLGVDPKWLQSKPGAAKLDTSKPISDSTADSLFKSLKSGSASLRTDKLVLVLPYNPIRPNPLASKEVLQFLDIVQKDRRPGRIPLLLVLRTAET